ncbi:MAG TPA: hypothetical protein VHE35_28535 [Kofleriaceae bacterium]|nr:hypothetical protein [Kofleriaceae bacterium]
MYERGPNRQGQREGGLATSSRTYVAFAELLQEWAEIPGDGPDALSWGAALAHEMTRGIWRGCNVRVLSADNALYRMLIADRISASLWRNRTPELYARAQELAASGAPVEPDEVPVLATGTDKMSAT